MKEKRVQFEYKNEVLFKSKFMNIKPRTMKSERGNPGAYLPYNARHKKRFKQLSHLVMTGTMGIFLKAILTS
jgi:hypothetical protein